MTELALRGTVEESSSRQVSILSMHRIGDGFVQGFRAAPLVRRTNSAIAPDLIDSPIDFNAVIIGVAELDCYLTAGAPASFEVYFDGVRAQAIARADNVDKSRHLKGKVMQLFITGLPFAGADQRQTMMIGIAAKKNHSARHHLLGIDVRNFEAQDPRIKCSGFFEIAHLQDYMAQLGDMKIHSCRRSHAF